MTLVEMAIAFVVNHPAVLDRIDKIVAPGTTPNPFDSAYVNPALTAGSLRR
jgi:hypothetical protein